MRILLEKYVRVLVKCDRSWMTGLSASSRTLFLTHIRIPEARKRPVAAGSGATPSNAYGTCRRKLGPNELLTRAWRSRASSPPGLRA